MQKANAECLLQALDLDRKLEDRFGTHLEVAYSPQVSTMSVKVRRDLELNKVVGFIKDSVPYQLKKSTHFGKKNQTQGYRLGGKGGFSVIVVQLPLSALDPRYVVKQED